MNFLAHLVLSCEDEDLMMGNFLADFLSPREVLALPANVYAGVVLHRQIDSYTDQHPLVKQGTSRLHARHGKYAPVVLDIFYDYALSVEWAFFGPWPFAAFSQQVYNLLLQRMHDMPEWLQPQVRDMVASQWLRQYGSHAGIADVFERMRYRVTRPDMLQHIEESLRESESWLLADFRRFFPEIQQYVLTQCQC